MRSRRRSGRRSTEPDGADVATNDFDRQTQPAWLDALDATAHGGRMKKASPLSIGYHAFTYEGAAFSGIVSTFEKVEGVVQFAYAYVEDGVSVVGSFAGEERGDLVIGAWQETSRQPIAGNTSWQGAASLRAIGGAEDRLLLEGTWTFEKQPLGRWTINVPG